MLRDRAVNRLELFLAPKFLGAKGVPVVGDLGLTTLAEAPSMELKRVRRIGEDILVTADLK